MKFNIPQILVHTPKYNFDKLWRRVRGDKTLKTFVQHETDTPMAMDLLRLGQSNPSWNTLAKAWFAKTLLGEMAFKGAMYGYESRRWLPSRNMNSDTPLAFDAADADEDVWNVYDWFVADVAGVYVTVQVTGNTGKIDFDTHPRLDLGGSVVNEGLTGFDLPATAVAHGRYKDLSVDPVELRPMSSVALQVVAATTGDGYAFIVGFPVNKDIGEVANLVKL